MKAVILNTSVVVTIFGVLLLTFGNNLGILLLMLGTLSLISNK
jgi:hypothetical protein